MAGSVQHDLRGRLSYLSYTSRAPSDIKAIKMRNIEKRVIEVYCLNTTDHSESGISALLVWACSRLTTDEDGMNRTTVEGLAGVLSGLMTLAGLGSLNNADNVTNALELAGYHMNVSMVTIANIKEQLTDDNVEAFLDKLADDDNIFTNDVKPALAVFCVILLIISRRITIEGFGKWYEKRVIGFINALGGETYATILSSTQFLDATAMLYLNNLFGSAFELRRLIFKVIAGMSCNEGTYSRVFEDLLTLFEYTEMTHIVLLDRYLYAKYPEILAMRCLNSEISPMQATWNYLGGMTQEDVPFTRLLRTREDSACLNRNNYPLLIAAASFETPSFSNYKTGINPNADTVTNMVKEYLTKRQELAVLAMGDDKNSRMSGRVSARFFGLIEETESSHSTEDIQRV